MQVIPYQPLLLRLLHGISALLALGALITGFLVYDSWDGRFGGLGLTTRDRNLIDIHGTFGFFLFFLFIAFALYSVTAGRKRLVQAASLQQLTQFGRPTWWVGLQRLTNTTMLLAAALAVGSGKFQDENWLPNGEMDHVAYFMHLIAWVLVLIGIAIHVLMSAKVGGIPLLVSMVNVKFRSDDWLVKQIRRLIRK
ncbi:MAG: cytochrome b/b6 domain-containing protein [Leptolyngbyaceae cyanobacterium bins.302]|nr:cytochrome b/b6 domain-containing protein [Leptolyngbyaceae cyanobacterium bins.302]